MSQFPTETEIIKAIESSGYLMEQEVGNILEKHGYHIKTNSSFKDIDTEISREIDILGIKRIHHDEKSKINIFIELICECKNNSNPFVFIGRNKTVPDKNHIPEEYVFPIKNYEKTISKTENRRSFKEIPAFFHLGLDKHHYYYTTDIKFIQFSKIVRNGKNEWVANHEGIFDSILYPLIKSFLHRKSEHKNNSKEWNNIWLHFPVVILNNKIYAIDSTKKEIILEDKKYLTLIREIDSKNFKGAFLIDFTKKECLGEYIEECIESFAKSVTNIINVDEDLFLNKEIKDLYN